VGSRILNLSRERWKGGSRSLYGLCGLVGRLRYFGCGGLLFARRNKQESILQGLHRNYFKLSLTALTCFCQACKRVQQSIGLKSNLVLICEFHPDFKCHLRIQ
jgi:hypothetical protein